MKGNIINAGLFINHTKPILFFISRVTNIISPISNCIPDLHESNENKIFKCTCIAIKRNIGGVTMTTP